jgi:Phage protein Gp138 N-terminal domain
MSGLPDYRRSPNLATVVDNAIKAALLGVHTSMPGKVVAYDPTKQVADVQPMLKTVRFDQNYDPAIEAIPILPAVPVRFPAAGGFRITFPVTVGDYGQVHFQESSIESFMQQGQLVDPADVRRFALSDAFFEPGLNPSNKAWTGASVSGITIGKDGGPQIVVRGNTIELGGSDATPPPNFVALANLVTAQLAALSAAFATWVPVPNDGGAALKAILSALQLGPPVWPGPVAATITKAE